MEVGTVLSVVQTLLSVLQTEDLKKALSIFGYKSKLDDLKETVETINAVLRDAEAKQQLSAQDQLFIDKLKDAAFEADDLFDEVLTLAAQKQLLKADGNISQKLSNFLSRSKNPFTMSSRIKCVKKKFDAIANNRQFSIQIDHEPIKKRSRETCSYIDEAKIIGREHDLENIVGKLLASDDQNDNVSVLSIVGIGGLGKTALAQLVYNDSRVTNTFPVKMWTCVSDEGQNELDVKNILCKILGRKQEGSTLGLEQVQEQLQDKLAGKKYLLVLDDVWTEKHHQWCKLAEYLIGGKRGSFIVVTTRSQNTATITGGFIYRLSGLSKENSWSLFIRTAFDSKQSNPPDEEMVRIGQKIVDGCAGVPLAIRVAGSLLYGQDKNKWMNIQEIGLANIRDADNDIVPILELSFHHLEAPLKNCFRYCALFPKDYEIEKEVLIRLWMAQGYICELDEGQSIENAAEEYFLILLKRCFFQDIQKNEKGEIESCKIHDLMHDLAQNVSHKEFYAVSTSSGNVEKYVRHLSICDMSQFEKYCSLDDNQVRSLLSFNSWIFALQQKIKNPGDLCHLAVDALLKSFKRLRVLDLSNKHIECLPESIGELLHLRYLDLSRNIEMKVLPNSITKLCNLQTFILSHCYRLKELPKDLNRLIKLRVLDIEHCNELRWIPRGMGKLTCLRTLKGEYIVGREGRCKSWKQWLDELEDLKTLINLKGKLRIRIKWPEKNAKNDVKEDSLREGLYLRSLEHLDILELHFERCYVEETYEEDEGIRMRVMEDMQPHCNLKRLLVLTYDGTEMPEFILFA